MRNPKAKLNGAIFAVGALALLVVAAVAFAGQGKPDDPPAQSLPNDGKTRVYVADSRSWEVGGGWGASDGTGAGAQRGGDRPQTAEIIKTFGERCPQVIVTNNKGRANFAVILDHEGGKSAFSKDNKVAVFNRDGDAIYSHSTASLGNAVKDACAAIMKDQASLHR